MCGVVGQSVPVHAAAVEAGEYGHSVLDPDVDHRADACDASLELPRTGGDFGRRRVSGTANSMAAIA